MIVKEYFAMQKIGEVLKRPATAPGGTGSESRGRPQARCVWSGLFPQVFDHQDEIGFAAFQVLDETP